jgi:uncharacterized membrane protein
MERRELNWLFTTKHFVTMISKITSAARNQLSNIWVIAVLTMLVANIIIGAVSLSTVGVIVIGHFSVGLATWSLDVANGNEPRLERIFDGFKSFVNPLVAYILMSVLIGAGIVFLIIPGIIIALGLSQTFYIIAENPETDGIKALQQSWNMMKGYKTTYFMLCLRYFLLSILCVLTLGFGFLLLAPYIQVTNANFYLELRGPKTDTFDNEYIVD